MLFNSPEFMFAFLPLAALIFFYIGRRFGQEYAISWLVFASLFFYGWWIPAYLGLILLSILFNYSIGIMMGWRDGAWSRVLLAIGVTANLALLGYYKYANFFVDNLNNLSGSNYHLSTIILPLAISFFTFQQIAYLVDVSRGETREYGFLHYCLFVTFFPQLIAGPIVHHKEMLPQFAREGVYRYKHRNLVIGLTIFAIGLFKKAVLADGIAVYATPVFGAAADGVPITFFEAWGGALAYTFQLYFDFSGYSDMAIGIARMFNIRLPINFNSPYKAVNIIDFWRRWHITLSRFLRDYLYIPLGGSRKGKLRRYINLMVTMLLGGLWHGAGWTFVIWGGLHGLFLAINHAFLSIKQWLLPGRTRSNWMTQSLARLVTFVAVCILWVFFRAENLDAAVNILQGMAGLHGAYLAGHWQASLGAAAGLLTQMGIVFDSSQLHTSFDKWNIFGITSLWLAVWMLPNTQQLMAAYRPTLQRVMPQRLPLVSTVLRWRPTVAWAVFSAVITVSSLLTLSRVSEFLYFQF